MDENNGSRLTVMVVDDNEDLREMLRYMVDGIAATRLLREIENMCSVPIVAISANRRELSQADAIAAGCNEYLTKPVNFHQLHSLLGNWLPSAV
jgi:CheY-like chemotaxis protein